MFQKKFTAGLYTHKTRPIAFSLVVDDFGVKYVNKEDMDHLVATIGKRYPPIKVDWKAEYYLGITIKWAGSEYDWVFNNVSIEVRVLHV
jgi:hypothetical protein